MTDAYCKFGGSQALQTPIAGRQSMVRYTPPLLVTCGWLLRAALAAVVALPGPELIVSVAHAQAAAPAPAPVKTTGDTFSTQQLDALLAPVALYPDELLMQMLMASTFPLDVVAAARWLQTPGHADLKGTALTDALQPLSWDPSVKSLVPFPQVVQQMNGNLEWMQQLGYAFANEQKNVLDSIQRLRRQAQSAGNLKSGPQIAVRTVSPQPAAQPVAQQPVGDQSYTQQQVVEQPAAQTIIIEPAQPDVVYVPSYTPSVYGSWPYPAYPPVAFPSYGYGYVPGAALATGLAFGAGLAITAGLWGWAGANWNRGDVNVNVNRWNNINGNRQRINSGTWNAAANRTAAQRQNLQRPPRGPVGSPSRPGLPANAIGRQSVQVPKNLVNRPRAPSTPRPAQRPASPRSGNQARPGAGGRQGLQGQGPGGNRGASLPQRQGGQGLGQNRGQSGLAGAGRPNPGAGLPNRPGGSNFGSQRPGGFSNMGDGRSAGQFGQRGAQSRQSMQRPSGFGGGGGGARGGGGGGGMRGGGGGGRGGGGGGGRGGGRGR